MKYFIFRREKEDLELEASELKQKLNLKNTEFMNLQQEFQEKAALLSLNELRIQQVILCMIIFENRNLIPKLIQIIWLQLTDTSQTLESQHQIVTVLEQQLAKMRETLQLVNNEKDENSKRFQSYIRQLTGQQTVLVEEVHIKTLFIKNKIIKTLIE